MKTRSALKQDLTLITKKVVLKLNSDLNGEFAHIIDYNVISNKFIIELEDATRLNIKRDEFNIYIPKKNTLSSRIITDDKSDEDDNSDDNSDDDKDDNSDDDEDEDDNSDEDDDDDEDDNSDDDNSSFEWLENDLDSNYSAESVDESDYKTTDESGIFKHSFDVKTYFYNSTKNNDEFRKLFGKSYNQLINSNFYNYVIKPTIETSLNNIGYSTEDCLNFNKCFLNAFEKCCIIKYETLYNNTKNICACCKRNRKCNWLWTLTGNNYIIGNDCHYRLKYYYILYIYLNDVCNIKHIKDKHLEEYRDKLQECLDNIAYSNNKVETKYKNFKK